MNDGLKANCKVLCGLILVFLVLISPTIAMTDEETAICMKKYGEEGYDYEKAKELCTKSAETIQPSISSGTQVLIQTPGGTVEASDGVLKVEPTQDECIRKYMDVYDIAYDDAKIKCYGTAPAVELTPTVVDSEVNKCGELEKKLSTLTEKLNKADGQEHEALKDDIEIIKKELGGCGNKTKEPTAMVLDLSDEKISPCDEVESLRQTREHMDEKMSYIEEMVQKGEMDKSELEDYEREAGYIDERLEKAKTACQQGTSIEETEPRTEETPCFLLSKFEMVYEKEKNKMETTNDGKLKLELQDELKKMKDSFNDLKEKCSAQDLEKENVESLYDLEKAYMAKQKLIFEEASEDELATKLQSIEEEKKKLIEEFASKMQELDLRQISIIKKMEIKGGKIYLDDIKTDSNKLKLEVDDKDIEIELKSEGISISDGEIIVNGDIGIEYENGVLVSSNSGKKINIMPSELGKKTEFLKKKFLKISIVDDGNPKYIAKIEEEGKFIGIIPLAVGIDYEISAETGDIMGIDAPWWSAFVTIPDST